MLGNQVFFLRTLALWRNAKPQTLLPSSRPHISRTVAACQRKLTALAVCLGFIFQPLLLGLLCLVCRLLLCVTLLQVGGIVAG